MKKLRVREILAAIVYDANNAGHFSHLDDLTLEAFTCFRVGVELTIQALARKPSADRQRGVGCGDLDLVDDTKAALSQTANVSEGGVFAMNSITLFLRNFFFKTVLPFLSTP